MTKKNQHQHKGRNESKLRKLRSISVIGDDKDQQFCEKVLRKKIVDKLNSTTRMSALARLI